MNLIYRSGTYVDTRAAYDVFIQAFADFTQRMRMQGADVWTDEEFISKFWERRKTLFEDLSSRADQFWVAENEGQIIGYARSILQDGVRELTECFVVPRCQSGGVGRELLARAFPARGARRRAIMATTDIHAQVLYLKSDVYPHFAINSFSRKPDSVSVETDLIYKPAANTSETLATFRAIDKAVLDFERDADHNYLLNDRQAYLYYRDGKAVGYGYMGNGTGPIALLRESDFPAVLAHAENEVNRRGDEQFSLKVPLINHTAVNYLLDRKFQLGDFLILFMSDRPFGKFENYIIAAPPLFF